MTWPAPTRADHERFCVLEGWRVVRDAKGRTGTHHVTYELTLPDGRTIRTRISHPPDRSCYGSALWGHILRDQLMVSEDEFWACVKNGVRPARGMPTPPVESLPAELVFLLIHRVGLPEAEVATLSKDEALGRLREFWSRER